jgi:RNA polymerase-binding transcription factor DksA
MGTMRDVDTQNARTRLIAQRDEVTARIASIAADLDAVAAASAGSNIDDEHDPEGASVAFEREQLAAIRAQDERQLGEIDQALRRVEAGEYGRCEACGEPIADERLAALPATRWCVNCASRRSARS